MSWHIFVTTSVITYALSVVMQRSLLRDKQLDPVSFSIVFQIITGLIIGLYALVNGFQFLNIQTVIFNFIAMIFLYGLGNVFIFKSLTNLDASEFTILFTTRVVWSIMAALLFLGEVVTLQTIVGTVCIIAGVLVSSTNIGKYNFTKGQIYALLAACAFGLAFVNDIYLIQDNDVPSYLSIAFILPGILLCFIYPKSVKNIPQVFSRKILSKLLLMDFFYAVSAVTIFLAYQFGKNASQIAPLNQTSTIVTVIFGILFLKERQNFMKKIIGVVLSFIGILLLA